MVLILSLVLLFSKICVWRGRGGGGGVSMLHNTLHEQIYRPMMLVMFYGWILNLVGCARYICVCWGGGGGMVGSRSVCAQFPSYSIPELILEIG